MLAETVERMLAPRHVALKKPVDASASQEVADALTGYMDQEVNTIKEMQKEAEAWQPAD
jgi:hypothetical protein